MVIGFSQSGARVIQNVQNKTPTDWSQNQMLAFSDFATKRGPSLTSFCLFWLNGPQNSQKNMLFLVLGPIRLPQVQLGFHVPRKKQVQKHSLRRRVEVFDSTTDPHWHVVIHEWVSGDMTWDHLKVGILKFRVINVSKDIDLTFRNLGKGWYEIHRYESRRLRISVSGVLWAEVLQRLQMQWFYQVPWQHQ